MFEACVKSTILYGSYTWTVKDDLDRLERNDMKNGVIGNVLQSKGIVAD